MAQWSISLSCTPEAAGLTPGCAKQLQRKTNGKTFTWVCQLWWPPKKGTAKKNKKHSNSVTFIYLFIHHIRPYSHPWEAFKYIKHYTSKWYIIFAFFLISSFNSKGPKPLGVKHIIPKGFLNKLKTSYSKIKIKKLLMIFTHSQGQINVSTKCLWCQIT